MNHNFSKKYKDIHFRLSTMINDYIDQIKICTNYDVCYFKQLYEVLEEIINFFEFDKEKEIEYKIDYSICLYNLKDEKAAIKSLNSIIKENPKIIKPYIILCDFELLKNPIDVDAIVKIVNKADKEGLVLNNADVYKMVVQYYMEHNNKNKLKHYKSILSEKFGFIEDYEEEDDEIEDCYEDFFDIDDIFSEEYFDEEELEEVLDNLGDYLKGSVRKNKTYEQYLKDNKENLLNYLTFYCMDKDVENVKKIQKLKDKKSYILENKADILMANITCLKKECFSLLKQLVKVKYEAISIREILDDIPLYITLYNLGIIFLELRDEDLLIHIPDENVDLIKNCLKDKEVIRKNKEINKIYSFFKGAIEAYGVIDIKSLYKIYNELFNKTEAKFYIDLELAFFCEINVLRIFDDNGALEYIHSAILDEERALKIAKKYPNMDYAKYSLQMYEKFASGEFFKQTPAYKRTNKKLQQELGFTLDAMLLEIKDILNMYIISCRINENDAKRMLDDYIDEINSISFEDDTEEDKIVQNTFADILVKGFNEIYKDYPDWNKKGRIMKKI